MMGRWNFEAVIFDMDGVLVDTLPYHFESWKRIADHLSIPFDQSSYRELHGLSRKKSLTQLLENSKKTLSQKDFDEVLIRKNEYFIEILDNLGSYNLIDGMELALDFLKARDIAMALGSASANARYIGELWNFDRWISIINDRTDCEETKPHPAVFLKCATDLGVDREKCLVIEDSDHGINAAKNANMKVLGIGNNYSESPDFNLKNALNLKDLLVLLLSPQIN